jgi:hypothetical protein
MGQPVAFFDNKELAYTDYVPRSKNVNADCIVESLSWFLEIFKKGYDGSWKLVLSFGTMRWLTLPPW